MKENMILNGGSVSAPQLPVLHVELGRKSDIGDVGKSPSSQRLVDSFWPLTVTELIKKTN